MTEDERKHFESLNWTPISVVSPLAKENTIRSNAITDETRNQWRKILGKDTAHFVLLRGKWVPRFVKLIVWQWAVARWRGMV